MAEDLQKAYREFQAALTAREGELRATEEEVTRLAGELAQKKTDLNGIEQKHRQERDALEQEFRTKKHELEKAQGVELTTLRREKEDLERSWRDAERKQRDLKQHVDRDRHALEPLERKIREEGGLLR